MTDVLRFLMSPEDRDRIDPASILVTETPFEPYPATVTDRWPGSMRLQFRVRNPAAGAPRLRMIFSGYLRYLPMGAGAIPTLANVQLQNGNVTAAAHATWMNTGRIRVGSYEPAGFLAARSRTIFGIGLGPTVSWFDPVEIPLDFLNEALLHGLTKMNVGDTLPRQPLNRSDPDWPRKAVVAFYHSFYEPPLGDVTQFPMPRMVMSAQGDVDLTITLAAHRDASETTEEFIGPKFLNVGSEHPGDNRYDVLPARVFLQQYRSSMAGADAGNAVADKIIGTNTFLSGVKVNLRDAGFGDLGVDNQLDLRTQWAVREFQIAAKAPMVGSENMVLTQERALRTTAVANDLPYPGPINGCLNALTRRTLAYWLRGDKNHRCPVVVTARTGPGYLALSPGGENLWAASDLPFEDRRMYVRDLSGNYNLPAADARDISVGGARFIILAYYETDQAGGPRMEAGHSWATMQVDADRLTGRPEPDLFNDPDPAPFSTYLTILPTVEEETGSRFDVLNAYDYQTISIPLFHYTWRAGELGGLLSYVRFRDAALYESAFGAFGIRPHRKWPNTQDFQAKHSSEMDAIREPGARYTTWPAGQADRDYFKSWHWFYRFVMAYRIFDRLKAIAYDFARVRLQDMRAAAMTARPQGNNAVAPHDGDGHEVTVGAVYTSEVVCAMLLRWHVISPKDIVNDQNQSGDHLWGALLQAQTLSATWAQPPRWNVAVDDWTDKHEEALIEGLAAEADSLPESDLKDSLARAFTTIQGFTRQGRTLSAARDSLHFAPPIR